MHLGEIESKIKAACLASRNAAERFFLLFVKVKTVVWHQAMQLKGIFLLFVKVKLRVWHQAMELKGIFYFC